MRKDGESTQKKKNDAVIPGLTEVVSVVSSQYTTTVILDLTRVGLVLGTNILPTSFGIIFLTINKDDIT